MYKCPECGYISVEPGECPSCSVSLVEAENDDINDDIDEELE